MPEKLPPCLADVSTVYTGLGVWPERLDLSILSLRHDWQDWGIGRPHSAGSKTLQKRHQRQIFERPNGAILLQSSRAFLRHITCVVAQTDPTCGARKIGHSLVGVEADTFCRVRSGPISSQALSQGGFIPQALGLPTGYLGSVEINVSFLNDLAALQKTGPAVDSQCLGVSP